MRAQMLYVVIVAAIACAACGRDSTRGRAVPLRREIGVPDAPPATLLASGEHRTPGVRYVADWPIMRHAVVMRPLTPVPWPSETFSTNRAAVSVVFATTIAPDHVLIEAYREIDENGEPTGKSVLTFECDGFSRPECAFVHAGSEVRIDDVPLAADASYAVVFAYWHIPEADRLRAETAFASASWIFRVDASDS